MTRRDLGSDRVWRERSNLHYQYRIEAASPDTFHLNPGEYDVHGGILVLFLFSSGPENVVFHRQ